MTRLLSHPAVLAALAVAGFFYTPLSYGWSPGLHCVEEQYPLFANIPWDALIAETFAAGRFPLWNPHNAWGTPLLGHYLPAAFFPLKFLLYLADSPAVRDAYVLVRLWLAVWGMTVLLERQSLSRPAALVGAIAFGFSGYFMRYANETYLNIEALLPWWMLAMERVARGRSARAIGLGAVCTMLILFGGNPEAAFYALIGACVWAVLRTAPGERGQALWSVGAAYMFGAFIALPQVLPFLAALAREMSFHEGWVGVLHYKAHDLLTLAYPTAWGAFADALATRTMPSANMLASLGSDTSYARSVLNWTPPYMGLIPMLFAGWGLTRVRRDKRCAPWIIVATVLAGMMWGLPWFHWLSTLPVIRITGTYKHLAPLLTLAVATLAAIGADHVMNRSRRHPHAAPAAVLIVVMLYPLATLVGQYRHAWGLWRDAAVSPATGTPLDTLPHYPASSGWTAALEKTAPPNLNILAGASDIRTLDGLYATAYVDMMAALTLSTRYEVIDAFNAAGGYFPIDRRALTSPLLPLAGVTHVHHNDPVPREDSLWVDRIFGITGDIEAPDAGYARVMSLPAGAHFRAGVYQHPPSRIRIDGRAPLPRRLSWVHGLIAAYAGPSPDGMGFMILCDIPGRAPRLVMSRFLHPHETGAPRYTRHPGESAPDCDGGQWVFVTLPGKTDDFDWAAWHGFPARDKERVLWDKTHRRVYRATGAPPRVWFDTRPLTVAEWSRNDMTAHDILSGERILVNTDEPPKVTRRESPAKVLITDRTADSLWVDVRTDTAGYLAVRESWAPGWEAWLVPRAPSTGTDPRPPQPIRIERAFDLFRAVAVPAGSWAVGFRYAPWEFRMGVWVALTTAALIPGLAYRRSRRTPANGAN